MSSVRVPSELKPIIPDYLENVKKILKEINKYSELLAVETDKEERLKMLSSGKQKTHNLKGNGGAYGFDEISRSAEKMEQMFIKLIDSEVSEIINRRNDGELLQSLKSESANLEDYLSSVSIDYI